MLNRELFEFMVERREVEVLFSNDDSKRNKFIDQTDLFQSFFKDLRCRFQSGYQGFGNLK